MVAKIQGPNAFPVGSRLMETLNAIAMVIGYATMGVAAVAIVGVVVALILLGISQRMD